MNFYVNFEIHIKIQIHKNSVFVVFPGKCVRENMTYVNLGRYVNFKIHIKIHIKNDTLKNPPPGLNQPFTRSQQDSSSSGGKLRGAVLLQSSLASYGSWVSSRHEIFQSTRAGGDDGDRDSERENTFYEVPVIFFSTHKIRGARSAPMSCLLEQRVASVSCWFWCMFSF